MKQRSGGSSGRCAVDNARNAGTDDSAHSGQEADSASSGNNTVKVKEKASPMGNGSAASKMLPKKKSNDETGEC